MVEQIYSNGHFQIMQDTKWKGHNPLFVRLTMAANNSKLKLVFIQMVRDLWTSMGY